MARIHIASDHAGYALKQELKQHLTAQGHDVTDHGCDAPASCDYPHFAHSLCEAVLAEPDGRGILICGTGIGMSIAANRHEGIRAALCTNEFLARATRMHNNANVLCLGERVVGAGLAASITDVFLGTEYEGGRHQRRIDLIELSAAKHA
ncbi:MAG: ribose 5-phosphate isomerase B [Desulfovibrionaceae bacterium]|nr:ribose 5-phosphate isomerase B [Desulfovibrionaceae bacterium]